MLKFLWLWYSSHTLLFSSFTFFGYNSGWMMKHSFSMSSYSLQDLKYLGVKSYLIVTHFSLISPVFILIPTLFLFGKSPSKSTSILILEKLIFVFLSMAISTCNEFCIDIANEILLHQKNLMAMIERISVLYLQEFPLQDQKMDPI